MATGSRLENPQQITSSPIDVRAFLRFIADTWAITKPEINFLIAITVVVSFLLARHGLHGVPILGVFNILVGTLLVSSGGATLNQVMERKLDGRMRRTARRPLVRGRVAPGTALLIGTSASIIGVLYLGVWVNGLSMIIASLALVIYVAAYTPLKRVTPLCTFVGAISGAAPPLIGWAGASGTMGRRAWLLYALLFLWQFPHFMAIAWMYRDDYAHAGYRVLPGPEHRQRFAASQAVIPAALLIPMSLIPWFESEAGYVYLGIAIVAGCAFVYSAIRFSLRTTNLTARQLLLASIIYLPVTFVVLLFDKR